MLLRSRVWARNAQSKVHRTLAEYSPCQRQLETSCGSLAPGSSGRETMGRASEGVLCSRSGKMALSFIVRGTCPEGAQSASFKKDLLFVSC
ncbi:uncharacterized protein BDV17DRAFT_266592 [Aspergillus undulatus]|uniref:uncharacterized protein n=1 Tax=Aspergillus undulatus TaxID=1810928 RepID=UPI003CCD0853